MTVVEGSDLVRARQQWEREHPRPESLRSAERAIVRALRTAGFGSQHQVTHDDSFEIAVDDLLIRVALDAPLAAPDPIRQSHIARFDNCALSLLLDVQSPLRQPSVLAARGTLFHRWVAAALRQMRASGEQFYPVEMGMELLLRIVAQQDVPDDEVVHVPMRELSWLRVLVTKWCEGGPFNAQRVLAVEEELSATVRVPDGNGGTYDRVLQGHTYVLVADPDPYTPGIVVVDWKTGWANPAKQSEPDPGQRREDRISDQGYVQQVVYGILVLLNFPSVQRVTLREAYIMYGEYREATVYRNDLERLLDVVTAVIAQADRAFADGPESRRWLPTAGTHCAMCPAARKCPIKEWVGIPADADEALQMAREWIVAGQVRKERLPYLHGWVDAHGPIEIDEGKGRRVVGWVENSTGNGRSFRIYEPEAAPDSPFDERMAQALAERLLARESRET